VRIAIVTTSYPLHEGQAAGHFVAAEAEDLCAAGHDVVVIAPGSETCAAGISPRVLRVNGGGLFGPPGVLARVRANPLRARGAVAFALQARRLLESRPFDRVIAHWLIPCAWPIAVGITPRLEVVAHGSDVQLFCALPGPLRRHIIRSLTRADVTVRCVSESLRAALVAATPPSLQALTRVEPSPIRVAPPLHSRDTLRARLGVPAGARLAVVVARLVPGKRVSTALDAIAHLPAVKVVVIGGGPLLAELRARFPRVRFTGELSRSQSLEWIAAANVLVSASVLEGAPTVVREARALGVPVVACPAGDLRLWAESDPGLWLT
jgi:teichuronic acid biosynthesis glycosyltransferase TuaC